MKPYIRDYNFYLANCEKFTFFGDTFDENKIRYDAEGDSALKCYKESENGKTLGCKDVITLRKVLITKASVNFHIKLWVEGWYDMGEPLEYYLTEFINPPDWVSQAIENQRIKYWYSK